MKHRKKIITFAAGALLPVFFTVPAMAASVLNQKILPLNCVFETVNNGTGTLRYLTPAECGILVNPSPEPSISNNANPDAQQQTAGEFDASRTVFFVPGRTSVGTGNTKAQLPWQPLATIAQSSGSTDKAIMPKPKLSATAVAGAVAGVVAVVVLVVFVI